MMECDTVQLIFYVSITKRSVLKETMDGRYAEKVLQNIEKYENYPK